MVVVSVDASSTACCETPAAAAVDGFPSEKLLSHLSEQLQAFVAARLRLIEFYEQVKRQSKNSRSRSDWSMA